MIIEINISGPGIFLNELGISVFDNFRQFFDVSRKLVIVTKCLMVMK